MEKIDMEKFKNNEIVKVKIHMRTGIYTIVFRYDILNDRSYIQTYYPVMFYEKLRDFMPTAKGHIDGLEFIFEKEE